MGSGVFIFNVKKEEKSWEEEHNTLLVALCVVVIMLVQQARGREGGERGILVHSRVHESSAGREICIETCLREERGGRGRVVFLLLLSSCVHQKNIMHTH